MAWVRSFEDVRERRARRDIAGGFIGWSTHFVRVPDDPEVDSPMAFLAEGAPGEGLRTHFHQVDQFQVVWRGSGSIGQHQLAPGDIHFARAFTPYGPLRNGAEEGLAYITLRAHRDPGARYLPEKREQLQAVTDRTPWQVTAAANFDLRAGGDGVAMRAVEGLQDDSGLGAWSIRMAPGTRCRAPDPSRGEGQYVLVLRGGVLHDGEFKEGLAILWSGKGDERVELVAGPEGMEGLVLNFPKAQGGRAGVTPEVVKDEELRVWMCVLCGFVYEEARGAPEHGIAAGTRWADVPESFGCPDCSAVKGDFEMVEV